MIPGRDASVFYLVINCISIVILRKESAIATIMFDNRSGVYCVFVDFIKANSFINQ